MGLLLGKKLFSLRSSLYDPKDGCAIKVLMQMNASLMALLLMMRLMIFIEETMVNVSMMNGQQLIDDVNGSMEYYLEKTFYKTASLMANSCKAIALLAGQSGAVATLAYDYGRHLVTTFV